MSLSITKKTLSEQDKANLQEYGIRNPDVFSYYYELTPHGTTFSKNIFAQIPSQGFLFKVPGPNQQNQQEAELILNNNNFDINSFSKVYKLEDFYVSSESTNPNYPLEAIFTSAGDVVKQRSEGFIVYADIFVPLIQEATHLISDAIASDPLISTFDSSALSFFINLPPYGAPAGPPITFYINNYPNSQMRNLWPYSQEDISLYVNVESQYYDIISQPYNELFNMYAKHVLEVIGWDRYLLGSIHFGDQFSQVLESPVPGASDRMFLINETVVEAYKEYVGDKNISAVPMSHHQGTEHLFAGGYNKDRWDTNDFYFADAFKGGPLDQPIPHPALIGEILSSNSLGTTVPQYDGNYYEEFTYKRHPSLFEEEYYQPSFIITKAAMEMLGYSFYGDKLISSTSLIDSFFNVSSKTKIGNDVSQLSKMRIRNYLNDKVTIRFADETQDRHLLVERNYAVEHNQNDKSVEQALKYFGYIPFGNTPSTSKLYGRLESAIIVENGEKSVESGINIFEGEAARVFARLDDYRIYISANCVSVHKNLGLDILGDSLLDRKGLLYKYFMAEAVLCRLCLPEDALELETEESANESDTERNIRYILVLHKDFEF